MRKRSMNCIRRRPAGTVSILCGPCPSRNALAMGLLRLELQVHARLFFMGMCIVGVGVRA